MNLLRAAAAIGAVMAISIATLASADMKEPTSRPDSTATMEKIVGCLKSMDYVEGEHFRVAVGATKEKGNIETPNWMTSDPVSGPQWEIDKRLCFKDPQKEIDARK
jgi:hypothetical protein